MAQTKQQKEWIALIALLIVAGFVWYFYFGKSRAANALVSATGPYTPINAEDYSLVFKKLDEARATDYKPSGRNIFIAGPAPVAPTALAKVETKPTVQRPPIICTQPQLPPPPPLPVLSMKYFGFGTMPATGARRAFLLDGNGDEVHIVQEGDTVENHIRITHIGNDRIEYEDINTGQKNSTNIEASPPV